MLDVSLHELAGRREEQVLSYELWLGVDEGHHVLQLVTKAVGASRLVVPAPGPEPAAHGLIREPAVHQRIEGIVRGPDMHGVEHLVPRRLAPRAGVRSGGHVPVTRDELAGVGEVSALAQEKEDLSAFAGLERMQAAYAHAIASGYRFYSYGDTSLLEGTPR